MSKPTIDFLQDIIKSKKISTNDANLICKRINSGLKINLDYFYDNDDIIVSNPNQGINYLKKLWKTPEGKARKNNPFGYREQMIIADFSHFVFKGSYDMSGFLSAKEWHTPLWKVFSNSGENFEYIWNGKGIDIKG